MNWTPRLRIVAPVVLAAAAGLVPPAGAQDGVVEINQALALAGSVTPGDAPGFPATLSVPGSYRLTSNLDVRVVGGTAKDTTAIQVTANGVSIDLNGFSILGPVVCTPDGNQPTTLVCTPTGGTGFGVQGIVATPGGAVGTTRVSNGSVIGMGNTGVLALEVRDIVAQSNGTYGVRGSIVRDALAIWNGSFGISGVTVSNCVASENGGDGVSAFAAHGLVSNGNTGYGIVASLVEGSGTSGNTTGFKVDLLLVDSAGNYNDDYGAEFDSRGTYRSSHFYFNGPTADSPQVSGGTQIGTNYCNLDTTCP